MAAGDVCRADTVYCETNSNVHCHDIYKPELLLVAGKQLHPEKDILLQIMSNLACSVMFSYQRLKA